MGRKTKKVGIAGKFGARYGSVVRQRWKALTDQQKGIQKCPKCESRTRNMRGTVGVWKCKKCGTKFSGGAWAPSTDRGRQSHRIAARLKRELAESGNE